jgi:hypothetical protein
VSFLRYADFHEPEGARTLLRGLLQDSDFLTLLRRTPPGHVTSFLAYAQHDEPEGATTVLRGLLDDGGFRALLGRTPPHFVVSFLRYADFHEPEGARSLLQDLLATAEFTQTAAAASAGQLAGFALFAMDRAKNEAFPWLLAVLALPGAHLMVREATPTDITALVRAVRSTSEDSAAPLAARLLRDWWPAFPRGVCPDGNELLAYGPILRLAHDLAPDIADELVRWLNSLDDQFCRAIFPIPFDQRRGLALALRDTGRMLVSTLWDALTLAD